MIGKHLSNDEIMRFNNARKLERQKAEATAKRSKVRKVKADSKELPRSAEEEQGA